ncbi:MAG: tetratricopeptide repeat protein, partial [Pseudobdellovibrionaceae bacterium]
MHSIVLDSAWAAKKQKTKQQQSLKKKKTVGELLKQASDASRGAGVQMSKTDTSLPGAKVQFSSSSKVNLDSVKPPPSTEIFKSESQDMVDYEKILDRQIQELFKLTQKFKSSNNRGELWLRLAELYVEKATLIDTRKQNEYDQKLRDFQSGKTNAKPTLSTAAAREYNRKSIQLYEWFQRDFPKDEKTSQALFFLGYNHFELGQVEAGSKYYKRLTQEYPNSPFVGEAHFALGEYYFESEKWKDAYKEYSPLIKDKQHRLNTFSLYKGGWCLFRLGRYKEALNYLEFIIKSGQASNKEESSSFRKVNRNRLESEALRDLVVFYAEAKGPEGAEDFFKQYAGDKYFSYMEKLAYQYSDRGNKENSKEVFKWLIAQNANTAKAFEYQYQIVQNYYYGKNTPQFKEELWKWVKDYGTSSSWYEANKDNTELQKNSYKLRETTLRNFVLQQHQTAQNSRAVYAQKSASQGYVIYLKEFPDSPTAADMHFYYGELLYDMKKYDEASIQYKWVVDNAPQSKFGNKSAQNLILAAERSVPSDKDLQKKVGNSLDPIPFDPSIERFLEITKWYLATYPNSDRHAEIEFRVGRIYYQHNRFNEASEMFKDIVKKYPNTKYSEYSANLLLDIFNLRKDYAGLEKTGSELLSQASISSSKAGADIRGVLEKASFKKAQNLEEQKQYAESAVEYEAFASKNPKSDLAATALFNAAINYEKAGQNSSAIRAYAFVLNSKDPKADAFKVKAKRLLAKRYQEAARYEEAARLFEELASENPKDPLAKNFIY